MFCFWCLVFLFPPCVLAGAHFCGSWPKGMFWSCQEGRRLGLANPWKKGAPSSPVPHHSVKEPRGATSPGLCFPTSCHEFAQCHRSPQLLPSTLSPPGSSEQTVGGGVTGGEVTTRRAGSLGFGSSFCPRCLAHMAHSAPGGRKPPHCRSVTWGPCLRKVPALDQSLGH